MPHALTVAGAQRRTVHTPNARLAISPEEISNAVAQFISPLRKGDVVVTRSPMRANSAKLASHGFAKRHVWRRTSYRAAFCRWRLHTCMVARIVDVDQASGWSDSGAPSQLGSQTNLPQLPSAIDPQAAELLQSVGRQFSVLQRCLAAELSGSAAHSHGLAASLGADIAALRDLLLPPQKVQCSAAVGEVPEGGGGGGGGGEGGGGGGSGSEGGSEWGEWGRGGAGAEAGGGVGTGGRAAPMPAGATTRGMSATPPGLGLGSFVPMLLGRPPAPAPAPAASGSGSTSAPSDRHRRPPRGGTATVPLSPAAMRSPGGPGLVFQYTGGGMAHIPVRESESVWPWHRDGPWRLQ
jgi:hypothetical protein